MRFLKWIAPLALLVMPAVASADEWSFPVDVRFGGGYSFPDGPAQPDFDETAYNSSYTFGVTRDDWTLSFAYLEASKDREGHAISLGYGPSGDCPLIESRAVSACSLSIQVRHVEDVDTVKYGFGVSGPIFEQNDNFKPQWTAGGSATTGDQTETVASLGLRLPFTFDPRGSDSDPNANPRWTLTGNVAATHGFETNSTVPTWGISLRYAFESGVGLTVGYQTTSVLNEAEDDLDLDRSAFAQLSYRF